MSFPEKLQTNFLPEEIQFLVENELVKILPRITTRRKKQQHGRNSQQVHGSSSLNWELISADSHNVNNMIAMRPTELPLWMALFLKEQKKCNMIPPTWLTASKLEKFLEFEIANPMKFSALPWHWLVVSKIYFSKCSDDLTDPVHVLRSKCQDLREIRAAKVHKGLEAMNESHLQLDNLSLLEINESRPFIIGVMNKMKDIHKATASSSSYNPENNGDDNDDTSNIYSNTSYNNESSLGYSSHNNNNSYLSDL
ncbi:hypothetical protein ACO0QE_004086 [Hanseniaspora vineae]